MASFKKINRLVRSHLGFLSKGTAVSKDRITLEEDCFTASQWRNDVGAWRPGDVSFAKRVYSSELDWRHYTAGFQEKKKMTSISFQISAVQTSFYFLFMSTRSQWAMSQKQKALVAAKSQLGVTGKRDQGMNQVPERKQKETWNHLRSRGKDTSLLKSPFWKAFAGLSGL